jgi:FG-GAP repeat/Cna protein B-type domain
MTFSGAPPDKILPGQTITLSTTSTGTQVNQDDNFDPGFMNDAGANPGFDINPKTSGFSLIYPTPVSNIPDPFLPTGVEGGQSVELTRSWTAPTTETSVFQGTFGPQTINNARLELFEEGAFSPAGVNGVFAEYYYDLVTHAPPLSVAFTGPAGSTSGSSAKVPNITNANLKNVTVTGTGDPGKIISVSIQDSNGTPVTGNDTTVGSDGTWTVSGIDATTLADGPVTYSVTETVDGQTTTAMLTATKSLLAVTSPMEIADSNDGAVGVSVAGTGIKAGEAISVTLSDGTNTTPTATTTVGTDGTWSVNGTINASNLSDGAITYTVTETDANGNVTTITPAGTKIPGPAVTITTAPNVTTANQHNLTVTGTGDSGDTITVTVTDGIDTLSPVTTTVSGGSWSVSSLDASTLDNGQITYIASETDAAGNTNSALQSAAKVFVALTSAPNIVSANQGGVTVTGTGNVGDAITLVITDGMHKSVTASTTVGADGTWSVGGINASGLASGPITYTATETDPGGPVPPAAQSAIKSTNVIGNYLGTGKTIPAVFRRLNAGTAQWFVQGSSVINGRSFGAGSLDIPLAVDFDGDGTTDLAVYRPSSSQWFVQESSTNYAGQLLTTFGGPKDIPVPADYNGTGKAVVAVYRPTTGQWFFAGQAQPLTFTTFKTGDIPVPGNYDNTGKDEPAIYRPSTGQWIIDGPNGVHTISFGGATDIPVPGAYNALTTGNAALEPAVWRPSTGQFFIRTPTGGTTTLQFKVGDVPAPGDYDGIGETEAAVYRPSTSQWLVMGPNDKTPRVVATYGGSSDTPTVAPYIERALKSGGGLISKFSVESPASIDLGATARLLATSTTLSSPLQTFSNSQTSATRLQPALKVLAVHTTPRLTILQRATELIDNPRTIHDIHGTAVT